MSAVGRPGCRRGTRIAGRAGAGVTRRHRRSGRRRRARRQSEPDWSRPTDEQDDQDDQQERRRPRRRDVLEVAGRVRPRPSRYSLTASMSQPTSVTISAMTPAASSQPPKTSPSMSIAVPIAPRNGRNDGPGMCTPGGGPSWMTAGSVGVVSRRGRGRRSAAPRQPVQQGQRQGDGTQQQDPGRRTRAPGTAGTPPSPRRSGRTTVPACGCRPASGARCAACRGALAARSSRRGRSRAGR